MASTTTWQPLQAYVRWRPLSASEAAAGTSEIERTAQRSSSVCSVSIAHPKHRAWKSPPAFKDIYETSDLNSKVYDAVVKQAVPKVLSGAYCNFFAYGHTGSGKTHTIIGYDFEDADYMGLCLVAAKQVFEGLEELNKLSTEDRLGVGFSLFELRKNTAYDLLNGRKPCHIRQGADGKTHIRGETEMLENGKVRVQPIMQRPCWSFEALKEQVRESLGLRAVGSSTLHDLSSRTHAVLELEIVNQALVDARKARDDRYSELVPVGKRTADTVVEESLKGLVKNPDGTYSSNPDYTAGEAIIEAATAEQAEFEARVEAAENHISQLLESEAAPDALGGKLVFVDLAGSEYQVSSQSASIKQTPQERMEGRQINTDLLALKEVIRACATNQNRIPFRSSPLTMVLREHFLGSKNGSSAMIVTASPSKEQYLASMNSLKYGSLVGAASA